MKSYDGNNMTQIRHLAIHRSVKPPKQRIGLSFYLLIAVAQISVYIDRCSISNDLKKNSIRCKV